MRRCLLMLIFVSMLISCTTTNTIQLNSNNEKKASVLLNKNLGSVSSDVDFYFSSIDIVKGNYILKFYFAVNRESRLKIDNIYVDDFIPIIVSGITFGKVYKYDIFYHKIPTQRKITIELPLTYKKIYLKGVGTYNKDFTINLKEYDSFLSKGLFRKSEDSDSKKPTLTISTPRLSNSTFRTEEFATIIKGRATDDEGIFQVYINNEIATLKSNGQFQKRIKLKIGKNPIVIKAIDINDNETIKEFLIIRDEIIEEEDFSDVDFALETSNNKPNAIAVVFGIEEYQYAPSVSNAYNDAEIMREYLISTFGLARKNIYFRYNERATKGEFDKVFSENGWIAKNADENSEIYVFYAGHGVASTENKSAYLIPNDIDPNYASTGYSLNELYQNLSKIKSKSTTIILDACFSGVSRENEMLLADSRPISIEVKQGSIPKNLNVFTASSGSEISSGFSQKMHGLFTYFFLKGLNKNADTNNDRTITYGEMEQYLKENVSSQARKMGREQNPQLHTNDKDKILLKY